MYIDVRIKHVTLPLLSVAMIVGNGMLIHVTLSHKRLRTVTNFLVLSLAVSDFLVGCLIVPLMVAAEEGVFGASPWVCLQVFSVAIALILVSCLTMMAIAIERFVAITKPLKHHAWMTPQNVLIMVLVCWMYAGIIGCLPMLGWNAIRQDTPDHHNTTNTSAHALLWEQDGQVVLVPDCRYQNVMAGSFVAFTYPGHFIPLWVLFILLYSRIYLRTRNQTCKDKVRRWSSSMQARKYSVGRMRENWRALRILAVIVGTFLFSWMPVVIWYCLLYRGFTVEIVHNLQPNLPYWFYNLGITMAFGNSAVNPFMYGFGNRSVRQAWIKFIRTNFTRLYTCGQKLRRNSSMGPFAQTNGTTTAATPAAPVPLSLQCTPPLIKDSQPL